MKTLRNLVVLVILAALLTMPAAAASGKAVMEPLQVDAQAGETFTVTVSLADAGNINVGTVALTYDANVFTMVGGKCLIEGTMFAQVMPDKNAGTFLLATPKVISGDIFVFEFVVNSGAASGQYALDMKASVGVGSGEYITATGATVVVEGSSSNAGSQTPEASGQESQPAQDAESDSQKNPDSLQPANPNGTKQDVTAPNEETFPWWLVGVAVAAIAVVVLAVVFKKKNQA